MDCQPHKIAENLWKCDVCGFEHHARFRRTCISPAAQPTNSQAIVNKQDDEQLATFAPIVQRLTPDGLTRLDRCRSANCGMMHRVNGAITCVGMQGKKCGWQAKWIRCLNREEEFGCGGWECPHWLNEVS